MKFGLKNIKSVKSGNKNITIIYQGTKKIWEEITGPILEGRFIWYTYDPTSGFITKNGNRYIKDIGNAAIPKLRVEYPDKVYLNSGDSSNWDIVEGTRIYVRFEDFEILKNKCSIIGRTEPTSSEGRWNLRLNSDTECEFYYRPVGGTDSFLQFPCPDDGVIELKKVNGELIINQVNYGPIGDMLNTTHTRSIGYYASSGNGNPYDDVSGNITIVELEVNGETYDWLTMTGDQGSTIQNEGGEVISSSGTYDGSMYSGVSLSLNSGYNVKIPLNYTTGPEEITGSQWIVDFGDGVGTVENNTSNSITIDLDDAGTTPFRPWIDIETSDNQGGKDFVLEFDVVASGDLRISQIYNGEYLILNKKLYTGHHAIHIPKMDRDPTYNTFTMYLNDADDFNTFRAEFTNISIKEVTSTSGSVMWFNGVTKEFEQLSSITENTSKVNEDTELIADKILAGEITTYIVTGDSTRDADYSMGRQYYKSQLTKLGITYGHNAQSGQTAWEWRDNIGTATLQQAIDLTPGDGTGTVLEYSFGINDYSDHSDTSIIKSDIIDGITQYLNAKPNADILFVSPVATGAADRTEELYQMYIEIKNEIDKCFVDGTSPMSQVLGSDIFYWDSTHQTHYGTKRLIDWILEHLVYDDLHDVLTIPEPIRYTAPHYNELTLGVENGYYNSNTGLPAPGEDWRRLISYPVEGTTKIKLFHGGNRYYVYEMNDAGDVLLNNNVAVEYKDGEHYFYTLPETKVLHCDITNDGPTWDTEGHVPTAVYVDETYYDNEVVHQGLFIRNSTKLPNAPYYTLKDGEFGSICRLYTEKFTEDDLNAFTNEPELLLKWYWGEETIPSGIVKDVNDKVYPVLEENGTALIELSSTVDTSQDYAIYPGVIEPGWVDNGDNTFTFTSTPDITSAFLKDILEDPAGNMNNVYINEMYVFDSDLDILSMQYDGSGYPVTKPQTEGYNISYSLWLSSSKGFVYAKNNTEEVQTATVGKMHSYKLNGEHILICLNEDEGAMFTKRNLNVNYGIQKLRLNEYLPGFPISVIDENKINSHLDFRYVDTGVVIDGRTSDFTMMMAFSKPDINLDTDQFLVGSGFGDNRIFLFHRGNDNPNEFALRIGRNGFNISVDDTIPINALCAVYNHDTGEIFGGIDGQPFQSFGNIVFDGSIDRSIVFGVKIPNHKSDTLPFKGELREGILSATMEDEAAWQAFWQRVSTL